MGSTGNLGLSVGLMGAALGFQTVVHMSADAKAWKKDLLRMGGATVIEYKGNYSDAVEKGQIQSQQNPKSYFVDDEHSVNLFLGYAVAASRLRRQLAEWEIPVDQEHPLLVCIPCGVGGAPGASHLACGKYSVIMCIAFCRTHGVTLHDTGNGVGITWQRMCSGHWSQRYHPGRRTGCGQTLRICRKDHGAAAGRLLYLI